MVRSVHLENFPTELFGKRDKKLESEFDVVMEICHRSLFLRQKNNLRVRLPLESITIYGSKEWESRLKGYFKTISDEVNVKNVFYSTDISSIGEKKVDLNMKKVGTFFGGDAQKIIKSVKSGDFKIEKDKNLLICNGFSLDNSYWSFNTVVKKDQDENVCAIDYNSISFVKLDTNVTPELEIEGYERDVIRMIQQSRKELNLKISDVCSGVKILLSKQVPEGVCKSKSFKDNVLKNLMFKKVEVEEGNLEKEAFKVLIEK